MERKAGTHHPIAEINQTANDSIRPNNSSSVVQARPKTTDDSENAVKVRDRTIKGRPEKADGYRYGLWTTGEKRRFRQGYETYGPSWAKIANHVGTRKLTQVVSYAQQAKKKEKPNSLAFTKWSHKERKKFKQAVQMFGDNKQKIADFIGTRTRMQVLSYIGNLNARYKQDKSLVSESLHHIMKTYTGSWNQRWTPKEKRDYFKAARKYGYNLRKIAKYVGTRNYAQVDSITARFCTLYK